MNNSTNASEDARDAASNRDSNAGLNNLGSSNNPSINLNNIVDYLKDHQRSMYTRETEWLFEKS